MHPLKILYSTNVMLSYKVAQLYYNDIHYVWCTPDFGSPGVSVSLISNPPTSQALYRYTCLLSEVKGGDLHGDLISKQKIGIKYGAEVKYTAGVINES